MTALLAVGSISHVLREFVLFGAEYQWTTLVVSART